MHSPVDVWCAVVNSVASTRKHSSSIHAVTPCASIYSKLDECNLDTEQSTTTRSIGEVVCSSSAEVLVHWQTINRRCVMLCWCTSLYLTDLVYGSCIILSKVMTFLMCETCALFDSGMLNYNRRAWLPIICTFICYFVPKFKGFQRGWKWSSSKKLCGRLLCNFNSVCAIVCNWCRWRLWLLSCAAWDCEQTAVLLYGRAEGRKTSKMGWAGRLLHTATHRLGAVHITGMDARGKYNSHKNYMYCM